MIQNWIVHHLRIIGEASRAMSVTFRDANPQIPWRQIAGMRHILVHSYFGVDQGIVWSVVENDLKNLRDEVQKLLP